jgi:hypothetical protein
MNVRILLSVVLGLAVAGGAAAQPPDLDRTIVLFPGLCEPSAAMAFGSGRFVVADDEEEDLYAYSIDRFSGFEDVEISDLTGLNNTADIEGATQIGDTFYWINSHSRTRGGNERVERRRLFAIRIDPKRVEKPELVGKPYLTLLEDLQRDARFVKYNLGDASRLPPEQEGALNIEGLAATPDGKLLIGFRNPIRDGKALVVTLNNPGDALEGQPAVFGEPIELDLGGLGIRSIEFWPARNAYAILAGAFGASSQFQIFGWPGRAGDRPVPMQGIDLTGLIPEALFLDGNELFILSDDGDVCPQDKAFRAARFRP